MAKKTKSVVNKTPVKKAAAPAKAPPLPRHQASRVPDGTEPPEVVELYAQVRGEVRIRMKLLDPNYTAEKLAKLLNAGNALWDVGDPARYHRVEKGGKLIAELEYVDEDTHWEQYRAD